MSDIYFTFDKGSHNPDDKKIEKLWKDKANYVKKIQDIFATMNKGDTASVQFTGSIYKVEIERAV